jgi:hypothetical protein
MSEAARTPEELEALLEDAFVTQDTEALSEMFTEGAVLALGVEPHAARGADEIGRLATALWENGHTYFESHLLRRAAPGGTGPRHRSCRSGPSDQRSAARRRRYLAIRDLAPVS